MRSIVLRAASNPLADAAVRRFWVVILPTVWEASDGRYHPDTFAYVRTLRSRGFRLIEPLARLGFRDYVSDDGHFSPSGARTTASVIVEALSR